MQACLLIDPAGRLIPYGARCVARHRDVRSKAAYSRCSETDNRDGRAERLFARHRNVSNAAAHSRSE